MTLTLSYFFPGLGLTPGVDLIRNWFTVAVIYTTFVGVIYLLQLYTRYVTRREPEKWYLGIVGLATFGISIVLALQPPIILSPTYTTWYNMIAGTIPASNNAMIGFFMASAVYRAFRARNLESTFLIVAAIFVMLRNVALGGAIHPGIPVIGDWLFAVVNTAAYRGITISMGMGTLIYAFRTLLGYERIVQS
jgi:hypothetical protein